MSVNFDCNMHESIASFDKWLISNKSPLHTLYTVYICHCSKDDIISIYLKSKNDKQNTYPKNTARKPNAKCKMQNVTKWKKEWRNWLNEEVEI